MNNTKINFSHNIPLSEYTTFKIGGPADLFIDVDSAEELQQVVKYANTQDIPFLVIGGGSNLLVCDCGVRGLVIKNSIAGLRKEENTIVAGAGEKLSGVVEFAGENSLAGLEFASGIPGTLGGAVYGNAGAYGKSMADILQRAKIMKRDGSIIEVSPEYFDFRYRWSRLKETGDIMLEAALKLKEGCCEEIAGEMERIIGERKKKHPSGEWGCAGSYFKNLDPPNPGERRIAAGKILDMAGAKGMKQGEAMVFPGHANFLTNPGGASCEDILKLAAILKEKVRKQFDIELEEEVIFIDENLNCI